MATTKKTAQAEEIKKAEQVVNAEQTEQVAASDIAPAETVEETETTEAAKPTVDLSKVAGFKAVDEAGNELGIVTMQELQDTIASQVLEVVSQRMQANTLEQPAMLAANASTRAASDGFENQLTEQSDFQWVRTLASDGSSTRVNKDNFAQVVGELFPIVDENKNGFMSSNIYKTTSYSLQLRGRTVYRILELENERWIRKGFHIIIITETGAISEYINCTTIIDDGSIVCNTRRIREFVSIKILMKDQTVYIYTNWASGTNYAAFVDSFYRITDCGALDDSYREMPISDL